MTRTECDENGRLPLGSELRHRYGTKSYIVEMPEKLVLLPVPDDPVKDLREIGRRLKGKTIRELRQAIEQQAMEEVGA
ncbi:MAG TPA: AbrB family transcriptional regulator [Phycisphaerae bacterium]|nr:AbrB family transcriptional regulator [Phycisphaerae bacterium]HRY71281.1 AbrB family transcriptional regulator [Phycisphaerae bacterium]HSA29627.1 AbrB family transcriptional regulator [Phycisphaerae bacterium]